jgi:hypothetical protein
VIISPNSHPLHRPRAGSKPPKAVAAATVGHNGVLHLSGIPFGLACRRRLVAPEPGLHNSRSPRLASAYAYTHRPCPHPRRNLLLYALKHCASLLYDSKHRLRYNMIRNVYTLLLYDFFCFKAFFISNSCN